MTEPLPIDAGGQPWSPDGTQLVGYDRNRQGLSLVTLATGMVTPLEKTTPVSGRAVWSPNGRYLAYSIPTETGAFAGQIAIYDIEAETETVIVEAMPQHALRAFAGWSFDSASIAFVHWVPSLEGPDGVAVLTVLDVANRRRVDFQAPAPNVINGATWSPTERRLLAYGWNSDIFGRPSPGFGVAAHQAIYLIDVELGSVELVKGPQDPRPASHPYYDGRARYSLGDQPWAPDGSGFVYSDRGRLCIYDFAARETTCPDKLASLVAGTGAVGTDDPSRSPTGEWIGLILKLEHVFCSPLAAVSSDGASFHYTDAARNDCALFWGNWSPRR